MSNFTPLVKKDYEFAGDKVYVSFSRLKRKDMLNIMPLMSAISKSQKEGNDDANTEAVSAMINTVLDLLPGYVSSFTGLKTADGEDISIEQASESMYFIDLTTDIVTDLIDESLVLQGKGGKKD